SKERTSPRHSFVHGGPADAFERRQLAAGGQARFADRVRASAADVVRRARAAPPLCPPARPVSPIAPRVRRPRRRLRRGAVESVAARAVLRRGAAGGASEVSRRRPARPPIQRAGPDAHGAHGHELAAPIHARDAPAADPAQPGARARVAGSPRRAAPDPRCRRDGRPHRRHRRLGLPGLQSSPSEGSQLLPPGGPRRADRPHPATQEPPGQRARLQAVGRVPAGADRGRAGPPGPVPAPGIPHGRRVFPARRAAAARCPPLRLRHQRRLLELAAPQTTGGRGAQEKTFAELKGEFALAVVPTKHYGANSAWQQLSVLAYNLARSFQLDTGVVPRRRSRKRTYTYVLRSMRTLRFTLVARAG